MEKRIVDPALQPFHKKAAVDLFNEVWTLMEKNDRTVEETDRMIHAAHASRFHWGEVGTPVHLARGEWQVSRVYAILGRAEPSLYHARRCLDLCERHAIGDFDLAYAYEALARAHAVGGDQEEALRCRALAVDAGQRITDEEDRKLLQSDIETVPVR
ncbi:MAG: hypothetical protein ACE15D_14275 [Candidatus Eisenbacteria bacterium]|nr:hypothetical protein [Candidatus Eisenbacteria bacterium]